MKNLLLVINSSLLFLCNSMYLGTGWSLLLFSFTIVPSVTPENYYLQFVPQVTAATSFFTGMTIVMFACGLAMAVAEWKTSDRWVPVIVLIAVAISTLITQLVILPINTEMAAGIADPARLSAVLGRWLMLNRVRVGLWTVQWVTMMYYFARKALSSATAGGKTAGST
jgi:hypothetical protein